MDANPYAAPEAPLVDAVPTADDAPFYVVGRGKFLLLSIATLGLYQYYWFYRHWAALNRRHRQYWPIVRAIFPIFFTHTLFDEVDHQLRRRGIASDWSPRALATTFVVAAIGSGVCDRLAGRGIGSPTTDVFALVLMLPLIGSLFVAQRAINAACGDPDARGNHRLTAANIAWLVVGGLVWSLLLLGLVAILLEGA